VHLLKYLAMGLAFLSLVMLALGSFTDGNARRAWSAGAALCVVATILMFAGLVGAQRQICSTLGGEWIAENEACRNEWGGNGNN
jgi:hypothetical protein